MAETLQKIREIDGKQLYYSFLAGAQRIFENQKYLNKINVFPVADADTGTNLASTMRSMVDANIPTDNPKQAAIALADAAITGARGNSGIIFAQFLYGFSNEIKTEQTLDIKTFAESMKKAVAYAYDAIANPVEGTILTVIKDWADYIYTLKDIIDDFIRLLYQAFEKAQQSLENTTRSLEQLARAHVVDAGAKGFVVWLEGILDFFTNEPLKKILSKTVPSFPEETDIDAVSHDIITFRYCTEALITGTNIDKIKIKTFLKNCGDSLVIAGSPQKTRVHIHTDFPAEVFSTLNRFGSITYQKVDDMVFQKEIQFNRKANIAILTDSTCDLPHEILDRYQIHVVPLTLHFGETFFLDRITIQPQQFYSLLEQSEQSPSSSQPAYKDFINKLEFLGSHYDAVIGITVSSRLSGTFSNCEKAAKEVATRLGKQMKVFDSKSVTGSLGMIILRIAESIENGIAYDELLPKIDDWIENSTIRVSVKTLKYIIRSGRVSPFKSFIARVLDLKPVIALDKTGATFLFSKSFTEKGSLKRALGSIKKLTKSHKFWNYTITHSNNTEAAIWYASELETLTGKKPLFVENASPVLVANTGPGVTCVSILFDV
ncbi:MAG: DegV family EDD domain-containing protein [Bacteroidetes bacterium]|nr:DegV family EDD domain-containing protein [Bacteroidota bacterium]